MLMDLLQHRWRTQEHQRHLVPPLGNHAPSPRKSYCTEQQPMRTEHVRSSLAPAGLAVQTSTFNALDSSDVGNATTNLSAKTAHGYYGRLVTLVAFTIAHPYNPIIVPSRPAFSSSPSRDGPVEPKVVRGALAVATTALLKPHRLVGFGVAGMEYWTIGKVARIVMEERGRVRVKSSRL